MKLERIKQLEVTAICLTAFLFPLVFTLNFPNPLISPKIILLAFGISLISLIKIFKNLVFKPNGFSFHTNSFDIPVLLLALGYLISSFIKTPNKHEAFWLPGTTTFVLAGALLYFFVNQLSENAKQVVKTSLILSGATAGFVSLLTVSGIFKSANAAALLKSENFTPVGSMLALAILFSTILPFALHSVIKSANLTVKAVLGVAAALIGLGLVISVFTLVKNWSQNQLPTLNNSWIVATESLKTSPLFGAGPGNYLSAYSRFLPTTNNSTEQSMLRFGNASSWYLTILTEAGLVGFASSLVLLLGILRRARAAWKAGDILPVVPMLLISFSFALFPAQPVLVVLLFLILALSQRGHMVHMFANSQSNASSLESKVAYGIIALPVFVLAVFSMYLTFKTTSAESTYFSALKYISSQDAQSGYDSLRNAIQKAPYIDRYHITYSQLNLLLANAVASKKDLSTEERTKVSQLIQQSIREGRSAVALNIQRSANWENLASVYRAVIPLAKGADQFAIQTYTQAISLDPTNPSPRIALGGVLYSLKRYEEAIDVFRLAAAVKPDNANTYYNLGIAYRDNSQYDKALAALSQVLKIIPSDSKDYDLVKKEIENVQSKNPKKGDQAKSGENLIPPTQLKEEEKLNPPVDLPTESAPEGAENPQPN